MAMENETAERVTEALRRGGFQQLETRRSSTSVTISAVKEGVTAVVHFTDTAAPAPARSGRVGVVPVHAVKAFAPGAGNARSGSGG
jgi:hypothetical protein